MDQNIAIGGLQKKEQSRATGTIIEGQLLLSPGFDELQSMFIEEARVNPFLEIEGPHPSEPQENTPADREEDDPVVSELECSGKASADDFNRLHQYTQEEPTVSENWENCVVVQRHNQHTTDSPSWIEDVAVDNCHGTLEAHLLRQLPIFGLDKQLEDDCRMIINELDANGYYPQNPPLRSVEKTRFELALQTVQKFDPPGVAARNLQECLLNQISRHDPKAETLRILISNHLPNIGTNNRTKIIRKTGLSSEELDNAIANIRTLNPRPSSGFASETRDVPFVTPDLRAVVTMDGSGRRKVKIVVTKLDVLFVSNPDRATIQQRMELESKDLTATPQRRQLIRALRQRANQHCKFLQMRYETLKTIGQAIAKIQKRFFQLGRSAIVPMTKREIAEIIDKDESTVSRAVRNKWIETPYGILELNEFFSTGNVDIKFLVQTIIQNEDKSKPLSDEVIRTILKKEHHVEINRRSIAKYREDLGILNSRYRMQETYSSSST